MYAVHSDGKPYCICAGGPAAEFAPGVVNIDHTFVDEALRGQGVAAQMMERIARSLRETGRKAIPTCSYAKKWFGQHPEYADVLR